MSLDKLIDVLSTNELFFAPLASFQETDPFEGFLQAVALEADASISQKFLDDAERSHALVAEHREKMGVPLAASERQLLSESLDVLRTSNRRLIPAIAKAQVVNCWHANDYQSEAMWRLYAENGKAVAIETTLDDLRRALDEVKSPYEVHIFPVKYLDYFDSALTPRDCVVEGHRAPLLKRKSYEHEHEVRAFIGRVAPNPRIVSDIAFWRPEPLRVPLNVETLVKAVHVSPYAREPFPSAVRSVCDKFGLKAGTVQTSGLLTGSGELLDRLLL